MLTVFLGLGAWTALGLAGHDAGPGPENRTWALVRSSIGEHGAFWDRKGPKATQSGTPASCARGESDCGDPTGMPEPITLLLCGAMLAGLGVVVRRGLRVRVVTTD